jgi:hypothetical protein
LLPLFPLHIKVAIRCGAQESTATAYRYFFPDGDFYFMEDTDGQE